MEAGWLSGAIPAPLSPEHQVTYSAERFAASQIYTRGKLIVVLFYQASRHWRTFDCSHVNSFCVRDTHSWLSGTMRGSLRRRRTKSNSLSSLLSNSFKRASSNSTCKLVSSKKFKLTLTILMECAKVSTQWRHT